MIRQAEVLSILSEVRVAGLSNIESNVSYRKTKFVVAANTLRESGDQDTKLIPPPPTRFRGTALSRPTAQTYMVLSTALALTNKSP